MIPPALPSRTTPMVSSTAPTPISSAAESKKPLATYVLGAVSYTHLTLPTIYSV